jgi:spore coat polysaccharide biosynthesis predicted glycosyltransferase SpsG
LSVIEDIIPDVVLVDTYDVDDEFLMAVSKRDCYLALVVDDPRDGVRCDCLSMGTYTRSPSSTLGAVLSQSGV